ncbi:MAG: class I SAM-dependent methyltransferase [Candidatus Nanopelagicales bacterium]
MPDEPTQPETAHAAPQRAAELAERSRSFGSWANEYDRYRPTYPDIAIEHALAQARRPVKHIVDVGAGTGQLSQRLRALDPDVAVTAVEPDERMRQVLAANIGQERVVAGSAEEIPLPDTSVDGALAAQMWHWVDPARACDELGRVIKPGGVLGILWNLRDDRVAWIAELNEQVPLADTYQWFKDHERPTLPGSFGPIELAEFEHVQTTDAEGLAGLYSTFSVVGLREDRDELLDTVRAFAATHPQLAGKPTVEIPYVCKVFTAVRD